MSRSAKVTQRILECAHTLCLRKGFSGFTLDELAEAAGVSRRTLFNHVGDKEHAVLGPELTLDDDELAEFRAGGPTGHLLTDMNHLLVATVRREPGIMSNLERRRRLLRAQPDLIPRLAKHVEALGEQICEHIRARPGETRERAEAASALLLVLVTQAARVSLHEDRDFLECLARRRQLMLELAAPADVPGTPRPRPDHR